MPNYGIHAYAKEEEKVIMNMWPEHCGAGGSQELMSSLQNFLENSVLDTVKSLCFLATVALVKQKLECFALYDVSD